MNSVQPWKDTRTLKHPALPAGRLTVRWLFGRWVPLAFTYPNGRQEDGLEALQAAGLRIREPFHPVPKLEEV